MNNDNNQKNGSSHNMPLNQFKGISKATENNFLVISNKWNNREKTPEVHEAISVENTEETEDFNGHQGKCTLYNIQAFNSNISIIVLL